MSEPLNQLEDLKQRLSNFSITALFPAILYFSENCWDENTGFKDNESLQFFQQIQTVAIKFREMENQAELCTGIPHFVLYMCASVLSDYSKLESNEEDTEKYARLALDYLAESIGCDFSYAYNVAGRLFFFGDNVLEKDEEKGLEYLKKATELPLTEHIGMDIQAVQKVMADEYAQCLALYEEAHKKNEPPKSKPKSELRETKGNATVASGTANMPAKTKEKLFTRGYYVAAWAAFFGYLVLSVFIRIEFELESAYELSVSSDHHWLLGILLTLLLNYSIIPLLMMAYFYKQNNGKHSKLLVILYFAFLVGCFIDAYLPFRNKKTWWFGVDADTGEMVWSVDKGLSGIKDWFYMLLYPTIFLVLHILLSLLIWVVLRTKEGDSDYRIYYGLVLFAPFMAPILLIAVLFWLFSGSARNSSGGQSSSTGTSKDPMMASIELKDSVRQQIINRGGLTRFAVYYDDNGYNYGWKGVDYWNNGCSLTKVAGEWGYTCFQTPEGKIYKIQTSSPDKEKIYFFE